MRIPLADSAEHPSVVSVLLFGLFAATLLGIAKFHHYAVKIAITGLVLVALTKVSLADFSLLDHFAHEGKELLNLGGLLLGFAVLANYFERSRVPEKLTEVLPAGRAGALLLLILVACLSFVLDNIAAALIGGSAAITLFRRKVHIGYLAAIVAASNAGGAGSVVGDTTTTMIWLAGVSPIDVLHAGIGSIVAIAFFGWFASGQQNKLYPMARSEHAAPPIDFVQLGIVGLILVGAVAMNIWKGLPAVGVWGAILLGGLLRKPDWKVLPAAATGMVFLLSLVMSASMMPVDGLPEASPATALGLGFVSAFFDNIPLTKLAIEQGGYDWGFLAYCVGYGGSMLWFGSSAGVAISGLFHEAKSAKAWLLNGWHVAVGYVLGFVAMTLVFGWHPHAAKNAGHEPSHAVHDEHTPNVNPPR